MRVCLIEACAENDAGSIGAWYIKIHAERAGYSVDILRRPKKGYDVELISVHHCTDFPRLARMPKRARYRLVGGHPTSSNARPVISFADAVCLGEGESWIGPALQRLEQYDNIEALADLPGTIISKDWVYGTPLPAPNVETPLPDNPPYLNRPGTGSAAWYIEMARGCPYSCQFCELGHSTPYRVYPADYLKKKIDLADVSITRKINFYAPDEASHPRYQELYDYLMERGYSTSFSSMRVESILRGEIPKIKTNHLLRVGLDGLTEATRRRVGKPITTGMVVEYLTRFVDRGHVRFKMFMIFGYPWEQVSDFDEWENLFAWIQSIPLRKNVLLRMKWTPFIPQPGTPLAGTTPQYDFAMVERIRMWHGLFAMPRSEPGWFTENDGLMSRKSHAFQVRLATGDEGVLLGPGARPLH